MVILADKDIDAGLVAHLDPTILREDSRTETNAAWIDSVYDYSVTEEHYFVILKQFDTNRWLCIPLFSKGDAVRRQLFEDEKNGYADKWSGDLSFYSPWQHWLIPVSAIIDASVNEESPGNNRRSYGRQKPNVLRGLITSIIDNRTPFHRPNPRPREG